MLSKNLTKLMLIAILIIFTVIGCQLKKETDKSPVLAEWEGGKLTENELNKRLNLIPEYYQPKGGFSAEQKQKMLDNYAVEEIFYLEAKSKGIDTLRSIQAEYLQYAEKSVLDLYKKDNINNQVVSSDKILKKYFDDHKDEYYKKIPNADILYIQTDNLTQAEKALAELNTGKEFAEVVKEYSTDKYSKKRDGKIFKVEKGEKITNVGRSELIDDYIFSSEIGTASDPIEFNDKFHIIEVVNRDTSEYKDFEKIKVRVKHRYTNDKTESITNNLKSKLIKKYHATIDTTALKNADFHKADTLTSYADTPLIISSEEAVVFTVADLRDVVRQMQTNRGPQLADYQARKKFLEERLADKVMFQDAIEKGYEDNPELKSQLARAKMVPILREYYKQFVIDQIVIPDEVIENTYNADKEKRFSHPASAKIKQFTFDDKETADFVLFKAKKVKDDEDKLNELIEEYCIEKANNGDISPIRENGPIPGRGRDAIFNENIFSTKEGEFSEIFQDKNEKYVFLLVKNLTPKSYTPLADVIETIRQKLIQEEQGNYFKNLQKEIKVKYALTLYPAKLEHKLAVDSLFNLAEDAMKRNNFNDAISCYDQIIKYYPNGNDDYKAKFMKGFIYAEYLKKNGKAKVMFEEVLAYPESKEHELNESAKYMLESLSGENNILDKINQESDSNKEQQNK
ncbi:MAG: peptidyl-prolyl cis-trans isomerase [Candidatus Cloacimonadota bacterium]|nr:peptidyl-prolyl cis-trans isomerase [Candidatus Cloacimonadota bacterium]